MTSRLHTIECNVWILHVCGDLLGGVTLLQLLQCCSSVTRFSIDIPKHGACMGESTRAQI